MILENVVRDQATDLDAILDRPLLRGQPCGGCTAVPGVEISDAATFFRLKFGSSSKDLKLLLLTCCARFSIDGVASVAATCRICSDIILLQGERKRLANRNLREVELRECIAEDDWLKYFPQTLTSKVSFGLECYVSRCPSLKSLESLLGRAPQLTDLGTGSFWSLRYPLWVSLTSYATVG